MITTKTIVLIHGMFVNDKTWTNWKTWLEAKGFTVFTPPNPGHDGDPATLRSHIHPELTKTGFEDVVSNIISLIDTLPEKPIVIGHSMAGLVVQKLVELGHAQAGVSIDGAPPKNVFPPLTTLLIVWPALNLFKGDSPYMGTRSWYRKAFFNTVSEADSQNYYDEFAVPESRKIGKDTVLKSFSNVDFKKPHVPLLFIAGEKDNIFPPSLTLRISKRYSDPNSIVDYHEFTGRSHFLCGEPQWEEIAEYILSWLSGLPHR